MLVSEQPFGKGRLQGHSFVQKMHSAQGMSRDAG